MLIGVPEWTRRAVRRAALASALRSEFSYCEKKRILIANIRFELILWLIFKIRSGGRNFRNFPK